MKLRAVLMACLAASTAYADTKHTLVLKADGNADGKVRAQIDAAILKLAKSGAEGVAAGDISFNDAAAAVGCAKPDAPTCKDDVLGMLSVDEVIATTVTRKPGGLEVLVRREPKTGAPREATAKITEATDPLDAQLGALFGAATATTPPPVAVVEPPKPEPPTPESTPPPDSKTPPPPETTPAPPPVLLPVTGDQQHTRLELAGMIGGAGLVLLGFVMWGQASGTQSDIDKAPSRTVMDLTNLQQLEKQGDNQASLGNLFFVGGLVLGGVSTYFFIRDRGRRQDPVARITPTVFPHGGGLALTIGGLP